MKYCVGMDLGQVNDFSAIAFVRSRMQVPTALANGIEPKAVAHYDVVHLERLPLGTSYLAVVDRLKGRLATAKLDSAPDVVVDATGLGRPVVDLIRARGIPRVVPVTIHGGERTTPDPADSRGHHVAKSDLVGALQVLFMTQRLRFAAALPLVGELERELLMFRYRISDASRDSYGAIGSAHDDLVIAITLATWFGERSRPVVRAYSPAGGGPWTPGMPVHRFPIG